MDNNNYYFKNKEWWEKMVAEKNGFTRPWLDLDPVIVQQYADGKLVKAPGQLAQIYPQSILKGIKGKNVLCLASSGGQQSTVFGILGANVTVFDISEGQLEGDKKAAEHYGYDYSASTDQSEFTPRSQGLLGEQGSKV